jgi:hypothetical protein
MQSLYSLTVRQFDHMLKQQLLSPVMSIPHPLATTNVYSMMMKHDEQLRMKSGFTARLVRMLSYGTASYTVSRRAYNKFMCINIRHVAAKMTVAMLDRMFNEAMRLLSMKQCIAAVALLEVSNTMEHLPSRALLASILVSGREGVATDRFRTFKLAFSGKQLGCHHCQGVLAYFYWNGLNPPDFVRVIKLAQDSSDKGSCHGQYILGLLYHHGHGVEKDYVKAVMLYRLAAEQNLADAQHILAYMYQNGYGVKKELCKARQFYQLAAAQGYNIPKEFR